MPERPCPIWLGYLLASPIRKFGQNPLTILRPNVSEGMRVLDVGCAMGFFSLPLAQMVGPAGRVYCVDMQERMLTVLGRRAEVLGREDRCVIGRQVAQEYVLDRVTWFTVGRTSTAVVHVLRCGLRVCDTKCPTLRNSQRLF